MAVPQLRPCNRVAAESAGTGLARRHRGDDMRRLALLFGLLLLIPSTRAILKRYLKTSLDARMNIHEIEYHADDEQ